MRADMPIGPYRSIVVLYKGELQLRYVVQGHDYFLWADSGWVDQDKSFVEQKTRSAVGNGCEYHIKYDPQRPSEAVVIPLRR